MSETLKVQLEDEQGNIYYLKTDASNVYCSDGTSVETKLNAKIDTASIVNNATTDDSNKVVSAAVAKKLQDQISGKVSYGSITKLAGINLDDNGAYIYGESNSGNIFFRYKNSSGNTDYANIKDISYLANSRDFPSKGEISAGTDLNSITTQGTYTLCQSYSNSPITYGIMFVFNPAYAYVAQIILASNNKLYFRFRNERLQYTDWRSI